MKIFRDHPAMLRAKYLPERTYWVEHTGDYIDGSPAILIRQDDGPPELKATVCLAEYDKTPPTGHCYIKTWEENEGLLESLIEAGILRDTGERVPCGNHGAEAALCKIEIRE